MSKENPKYRGIYVDESGNPIPGAKEFIDWKSRSVASSIIILAETGQDGYVFLTTKRGPNCPDNIGKLVFTCGYLNWDETVAEGACREVYEETGLRLTPSDLMVAGWNDLPSENRQNLTFRWVALMDFEKLNELIQTGALNTDTVSRGGEPGECDEIKLMAYSEIKGHDELFAFGHAGLAQMVVENLEKIKKLQPLIRPLIKSLGV